MSVNGFGAIGGWAKSPFRPQCGSTVYAVAGKHPAMIGVAVDALADPDFPPPARSVWERSMHRWLAMPEGRAAFSEGAGVEGRRPAPAAAGVPERDAGAPT